MVVFVYKCFGSAMLILWSTLFVYMGLCLLQSLIKNNPFNQLVTKTHPRLRRYNRWLLYFTELSGNVLKKERKFAEILYWIQTKIHKIEYLENETEIWTSDGGLK